MAQKIISWDNPTEYVDGTKITQEELAESQVYIFRDGEKVYETLRGITNEFPIEVNKGETNEWQLSIVINGVESDKSDPFEYMLPFPIPNPPVNVNII